MKTRNMTSSNTQSVNGMPVPWGMDPLLGLPSWEAKDTPSLKVLLVDDDPMFCAAAERKAKKMHLDLTICKTLGDVTRLADKPDFDVAILDYFFGEELTAFQIAHLFSHEVPVVLMSNTEGRKLSGDTWPAEIRTFLHKSAGIDAIFAEAFLAAHWGHILPTRNKTEVPELIGYEAPWWLPLAAVIAAAGALALLHFAAQVSHKPKFWDWEKSLVQPSRFYSYGVPDEGPRRR